ncbi:MAG: hypothetical protein GY943_23775 [Chloroflexi bacterium]|nr:hypothetical protein [Chloroflexota bacterium]
MAFMLLALIVQALQQGEMRLGRRFGSGRTIRKEEDPFGYWSAMIWFLFLFGLCVVAIYQFVTY